MRSRFQALQQERRDAEEEEQRLRHQEEEERDAWSDREEEEDDEADDEYDDPEHTPHLDISGGGARSARRRLQMLPDIGEVSQESAGSDSGEEPAAPEQQLAASTQAPQRGGVAPSPGGRG
ncbi:hypothetical protein T484DRAFT_1884967, partial [Baffinella frigidus]